MTDALDGVVVPALLQALKAAEAGDFAPLKALVALPIMGVRVVPFLTTGFCARVVRLADEAAAKAGGYAPDPGDPYPGRELSLYSVPEMVPTVEALFHRVFRPLVALLYQGFTVDVVHDVFVLRYSMDTQRSMDEHFDESSDVSGSVSLSDAWTGPGIEFVGAGWNTREVPVGHLVLFPGRVTHKHAAPPLESGVRHSMTWWTSGMRD